MRSALFVVAVAWWAGAVAVSMTGMQEDGLQENSSLEDVATRFSLAASEDEMRAAAAHESAAGLPSLPSSDLDEAVLGDPALLRRHSEAAASSHAKARRAYIIALRAHEMLDGPEVATDEDEDDADEPLTELTIDPEVEALSAQVDTSNATVDNPLSSEVESMKQQLERAQQQIEDEAKKVSDAKQEANQAKADAARVEAQAKTTTAGTMASVARQERALIDRLEGKHDARQQNAAAQALQSKKAIEEMVKERKDAEVARQADACKRQHWGLTPFVCSCRKPWRKSRKQSFLSTRRHASCLRNKHNLGVKMHCWTGTTKTRSDVLLWSRKLPRGKVPHFKERRN
jgi:hypothetical protein